MTDSTQTTHPQRIQRKRSSGWRKPGGCVCVDRTTGFGNPFPVHRCNSTSQAVTRPVWSVGTWTGPAMWFKDTRQEAIALAVEAYRAWINQPQQDTLREKAALVLKGQDLICWCPVDQPCHADVLLEIANDTNHS